MRKTTPAADVGRKSDAKTGVIKCKFRVTLIHSSRKNREEMSPRFWLICPPVSHLYCCCCCCSLKSWCCNLHYRHTIQRYTLRPLSAEEIREKASILKSVCYPWDLAVWQQCIQMYTVPYGRIRRWRYRLSSFCRRAFFRRSGTTPAQFAGPEH